MVHHTPSNRRPRPASLAEWAEPALQPAHRKPPSDTEPLLSLLALPAEDIRIEVTDGPLRGSLIWIPVPPTAFRSVAALLARRRAAMH